MWFLDVVFGIVAFGCQVWLFGVVFGWGMVGRSQFTIFNFRRRQLRSGFLSFVVRMDVDD